MIAAGVILALTVGTLVAVYLRADPGRGFGPAEWAAIRFTVVQAVLSAVLSVLPAVFVARALARRRFPGRAALITLLGAPFILPVIVAILGLLAVFGQSGLVSRGLSLFGLPPVSIYGLHGVVLAHVFFNMPLATRLILQGWAAIPGEHFRLAAALGFRPRDVFRHLEAPMLREVVPGALAVIFLICLTSFAVALTLGGGPAATTVELAIYQAFRFDFDLARAATLSLVQFGLCAVAAMVAGLIAVPRVTSGGLDRPVERWDSGGRFLDVAALVLASAFLLLPLAMVTVRGIGGLALLPPDIWRAAWVSVQVAALSTVLLLALAVPLALFAVRLGRRGVVVEVLGGLTIAASPLVMGTGLFLMIFPFADPQAVALPVTALVNAAVCVPFALRALIPALREIESDYGRLAASLGMREGAWLWHVALPRLRRPLGFAAGLAAALSMGDLGVIALFADPQAGTLPLALYRLMTAYRMDAAAGAALLLLALSLLAFWVCDRGGRMDADA